MTVDIGYSNSAVESGADPNYVNTQYANFLALQANRQPFDVITGKRNYTNMIITLLHTTTDEATENALFLTVRMREIIIVNTQTVSVHQPITWPVLKATAQLLVSARSKHSTPGVSKGQLLRVPRLQLLERAVFGGFGQGG